MGDVRRPNANDKVAISERRRKVAALALACSSQREISRTLGVALGTVCMDLQALRKEWREESLSDLDALITRETAGLDDIEAKAASQFAQTHEPTWLALRLKAKAQRMALLGLSKQKIEVSGPGGGPLRFSEVIVELPAARLDPEPAGQDPSAEPALPPNSPHGLEVVMDLPG